jgi:para-aminobenzoate synthetase/4-amino-4-deoxychorismate lyase
MDAAPAVFALLDDASPHTGPGGWNQARSRLYRDHAGTLACHTIDAWPSLLARLQDALARGLYAVPVLGYELGEQLLGVAAGAAGRIVDGPLAQVLLFARHEELDASRPGWRNAPPQTAPVPPASPRCAPTSTKRRSNAPSAPSTITSRPATLTR